MQSKLDMLCEQLKKNNVPYVFQSGRFVDLVIPDGKKPVLYITAGYVTDEESKGGPLSYYAELQRLPCHEFGYSYQWSELACSYVIKEGLSVSDIISLWKVLANEDPDREGNAGCLK